MQYLALIHRNTDTEPTNKEWSKFIEASLKTGMFNGGSALGSPLTLGKNIEMNATEHIGGFMRFDTDKLEVLLKLLKDHPVIRHGGTIELCEMPKS